MIKIASNKRRTIDVCGNRIWKSMTYLSFLIMIKLKVIPNSDL